MPVTPADFASAEALFRERFEADPAVSRQWIAMHRARLIRQLAVAECQRRENAEWNQKFAVKAQKERIAA